MPQSRADPAVGSGAGEDWLVLGAAQGGVDVAGGAEIIGPRAWHERGRVAVPGGVVLHRLLEEDMPVGHLQRVRVVEVDLPLAMAVFDLRDLGRDPALVQGQPQAAEERLHSVALGDVVVGVDGGGRRQLAVPGGAQFSSRAATEVELQLGGRARTQVLLGKRADLLPEDRSGRDR